jgi:hypothetical protein
MKITQRPVTFKPPKAKPKAKHMAKVAALPCVICHEWGLPQESKTQVHHVIHGRFASRRVPDEMTIPLCEGHHVGNFDTSKIAIHREPAKWERLYGPDHEWLSWVEERIEQG